MQRSDRLIDDSAFDFNKLAVKLWQCQRAFRLIGRVLPEHLNNALAGLAVATTEQFQATAENEAIQTGVYVIGLIALGFYQGYRIKGLKGQIKSQDEILGSVKTLVDMIKPELLKHRTEEYEKLIEEKKDFEITKIQDEMRKKIKQTEKSREEIAEVVLNLTTIIFGILFDFPHEKRLEILDKIHDERVKKWFKENAIPKYEGYDAEISKLAPIR